MCGIHGVINRAPIAKIELRDYIADAFVVNTLRGTDSAGVFQIDKDNKPFMHKQNVPGYMFAETKTVKRFLLDVDNCPVTVGHVRAATAGKVTVDNAHPFVAERDDGSRVVGVHNGTISNWKSYGDSKDYEVDSEWALNQIAKDGVDAFEKFSGSYCFVWWDEAKPDKLFMVRNDERPMHFVRSAAKDTILFGSEAGMVTWLAERRKILVDDTIYSLEPYHMYAFDLSKKGIITWTKVKTPKYKYIAPANTTGYTSNANRHGRWNAQSGRWEDPPIAGTGSAYGAEYDDDDWRDHRYNREAATRSSGRVVGGGTGPGDSFPASGANFVNQFKSAVEDNRNKRAAAGIAAIKAASGQRSSARGSSSLAVQPAATGPVHLVPKSFDPVKSISKREQRRLRAAARAAHKKTLAAAKTEKPADAGIRDRAFIDSTGEYVAPAHWYSTQTATSTEQQAAKSLGVMGQIDFLQGVCFEPDTGELLGDIQEYLPGDGKITHTGVVRNLSATAAANRWVNNGGQWGVIIGVSDDKDMPGGKVFIVSEMTDIGKEQMKTRAA